MKKFNDVPEKKNFFESVSWKLSSWVHYLRHEILRMGNLENTYGTATSVKIGALNIGAQSHRSYYNKHFQMIWIFIPRLFP